MASIQRIRRRAYEIMDGAVPDKYSHFVEVFVALLVVANVIGIILESVPEIHEAFEGYFHAFDLFSVAVFSVEFVMRVWSYGEKYLHDEDGSEWKGRKEYLFSFYGIIDFVSTVPFYLQLIFPGADLRVLRMFRLLRIFKLSRYNSAFDDMVAAVKAERDSFSSAVFLLFISCLLFSSLIYINLAALQHRAHAVAHLIFKRPILTRQLHTQIQTLLTIQRFNLHIHRLIIHLSAGFPKARH